MSLRIIEIMASEIERGISIVDEPMDADEGETIFGQRWGKQVFRLTEAELEALRQGRYVALDIQGEYIAYLQIDGGKSP